MGELETHGGSQQGAGISQVTVGTDGANDMASQPGTEGHNRTGKGRADCDPHQNTLLVELPNGENRPGTVNKD